MLNVVSQVQTSIVRIPDFRRLWSASTVSYLGSEISELALPLLAISVLGASDSEVGALRAAHFARFLIATLAVGVIADRRRRRPLMIGADLLRFATTVSIPVAVWFGAGGVSWLLPVVFVTGIGTVVYQTADYAYLPTLIDKRRLVTANSWLGASQSAAAIGGKGLGGALVAAVGAPVAVLTDAVSYLVSAFNLSRITRPEPPPQPTERGTARRDLIVGLETIFQNRLLRPLLGEAATYNLFNEAFVTALLIYTAGTVGLSAASIGGIFVLGAIGALLGATIGHAVSDRLGFGRALLATMAIGNTGALIAWAAMPTATATTLATGGALFVMGFGSGAANVHTTSLRQSAAPNHVQAKLNAAYRFISWGAIPIGAAAGGLLAARYGSRTAMNIAALGVPLATIWVAASSIPRLTRLDDIDAAHTATSR